MTETLELDDALDDPAGRHQHRPWQTRLPGGLGWWAGAMGLFFVPDALVFPVFLAVVLLCEIAFGIYLMRLEHWVFANA